MSITVREAIRRKVWLWVIIIVFAVAVADWASTLATGSRMGSMPMGDIRPAAAQMMGRGIILFFSSIIAVALAAGQITGELERGVLATILPKPINRFQVYLGKWLGVIVFADAVVLLSFSLNWVALCIIYGMKNGLGWHWEGLGVMMLYPMLYGTMTLAWSSFGGMVVSLLLTATLYAVTFLGDAIVSVIAKITENHALERLQILSTWVIPHARLSSWLSAADSDLFSQASARFGMVVPAELVDKLYVVGYMAVFFVLAYVVFSRRDVQ
jgi:ABC-type transport system involved in multi-copper enzyme maturation permease subunit